MRIQKLFLSSSGFTLLELLVVIMVIGAVAMLGVSSFANYSRDQRFNQAVLTFVNTLNTAKSKAYAQDKQTSFAECAANRALNGYSVSFNANSYSLLINCSGGSRTLSTVSLTAFSTSITTAPRTVSFKVLTGAVSGSGNIVFTSSGKNKTVNITPVGVITVQ